MEKKTASAIMLTLLLTSMLTLAFNTSFVKAVADPIVSGTVRDKLGNPIPDVLIVAQDATTEIDVASTTSSATGAYAVSVPPDTYNFIVRPPPESGFVNTTISNIEVTTDVVMDIVLVPAETVNFTGELLDRDGNPVPNQLVILDSPAVHEKSVLTDAQGLFSIQVPPDYYSLRFYGGYAPNVPSWSSIGKGINITQDTFLTFTLQNRYLSGKVVDPNGNPVDNVSIAIEWGNTAFDDFYGSFSSWTKSDSQGDFNVTVFPSIISLKATPPEGSRFVAVLITNIDVTGDKVILIALVYKLGLQPIANFAWTPTIPRVGDCVTFNASASTPDGGELVSYKWDFGDGHYDSGKIVTHTYASLGTYTVTLNVTDSEGLWDIEQKQIQVEALPPPPLSVSISPLSASLVLGQSVTFTSTVSGGVTPYGYQWYVNSALVPSATSASWTFTPSTSGIYYVYLKVTDASSNASQSETARIVVVTVPVGGYSIAIGPQTKAEPVLPYYIALIAALTAIFTKLRPKTKRKR
jgi:PKD repeat protein